MQKKLMKQILCRTVLRAISLLFLTVFFTISSRAQNHVKTVMKSFVFENNAYSYEFIRDDFDQFKFRITRLVKPEGDEYETESSTGKDSLTSKQAKKGDSTKSMITDSAFVVFDSFDKEVFKMIFKKKMLLYDKSFDNRKLEDKATEVFLAINMKLDFLDDEPLTAYAKLKRDYIYSFMISNLSPYYNKRLSEVVVKHSIASVDVETEDGTIKNIKVHLVAPAESNYEQSPRKYLEFKNVYPISIAGKFDNEKFADQNLHCINCYGIKGLNRYIKLSDLMNIDIILQNYKEDYSPANTTFNLSPTNPIVELKKEKRSKIIEVAAFSDFVGLDAEEPNGLVQIEAKRKINVNTYHRPIRRITLNRPTYIADQYDLSKYQFYSWRKGQNMPNVDYQKKADTGVKSAIDSGKVASDYSSKANLSISVKKIETSTIVKKLSELEVAHADSVRARKIKDSINTAESYASQLEKRGDKGNVKYFLIPRNDPNYKRTFIPDSVLVKMDYHSITLSKPVGTAYINWFGSIEPKLLFSKIEENNRFLKLDAGRSESGKIEPVKLFQHQNSQFGTSLNVVKLYSTNYKFTWNILEVGTYWSRSRVQRVSEEATGNSTALNTLQVLGSTNILFRHDSRWGTNIGLSYYYQRTLNPEFKLKKSLGLVQTNFDAFLKTNADSKLFLRVRWTFDTAEWKSNFAQVQVGYSINLFAVNNGTGNK